MTAYRVRPDDNPWYNDMEGAASSSPHKEQGDACVLKHGSNVTASSVPRSDQCRGGRQRIQPVFRVVLIAS